MRFEAVGRLLVSSFALRFRGCVTRRLQLFGVYLLLCAGNRVGALASMGYVFSEGRLLSLKASEWLVLAVGGLLSASLALAF